MAGHQVHGAVQVVIRVHGLTVHVAGATIIGAVARTLGRRAIARENVSLSDDWRTDRHAFDAPDVTSDIVACGLSEQMRMRPGEGEHLVAARVITAKFSIRTRRWRRIAYLYMVHIRSMAVSDGHGT